MKCTGPACCAKPVHMRRDVHMLQNIRNNTRPSFNATSINSATDAPLHANDCRPDLGFSTLPRPRIFNAGRHGPTHHSLSLSLPRLLRYD